MNSGMISKSLNNIKKQPELWILALMIVIIAMLVIPIPTFLMDFFIAMNIIIAALVFLSSFYIDRILSFSSFPAVLLITTLFRLALSISSTRLILTNADAGEIIATFGEFVIGDNLIVGFVIFAIVTIVQFMVVTKGAERVAEVAARFSLDGMPGKQMSIDADLKNGAIDSDEAKQRRSVLEKESQLYGSFDGAMKFIKGDAIAGIIVIFINLIGGISVGVSQHGMDMSTAMHTYTMLTIGDGLVAQIPSLLIAISAGFIVTRVSGEGNNMGQTMMGQLLNNRLVLLVAAFIALGIGSLPGFPLPVFMGLALVLAFLFYLKWREATPVQKGKALHDGSHAPGAGDKGESELGLISNLDATPAEAVPLILLVDEKILPTLEKAQAAERYRSQFFIDYGLQLPEFVLKAQANLKPGEVILLINEIQAGSFTLFIDALRVINSSEELDNIGIRPVSRENGYWVAKDDAATLTQLGFQLRPAIDDLYSFLSALLVLHVNEFFGVQETKNMLDKLEGKYPDLIKEVLRHATIQRICEVIQRLVGERISVRNLKLIIEALAVWAPREKDVITLVEHVRGVLARYISHKFAVNNLLRVIMLSAEFEEQLRNGIRNTSSGAFLNLEPAVADELMDRFSLAMDSLTMASRDLAVLTSVDIRRFVKIFLSARFKNLEVLSYGEISESVSLEVIRTI